MSTTSDSRPLPTCIWLTGLSGAGKTTLAERLGRQLAAAGHRPYVLDGDRLRTGLNNDLGFSPADRAENVRRTAEVAWLMADAGLLVIASLISPFEAERQRARARFAAGRFIEIHVDTPLSVCEARDTKGLYARARRGELRQFTGIDSPYEAPAAPDIRVDTSQSTPDESVSALMEELKVLLG